MKKNIECLKQWIEEYESEVIEERKDELNGFITTLSHGKQSAIKKIKQKIDQLDKPEILSQGYNQQAYRDGFREGERQTAEYFESITEEPSKEQVWKYLSEHGLEVVERTTNRYVVLTDNDFYVGSVSIQGDGTFRSLGATYSKDKALKFDKREHAQTIVDLFGQGRVKEIKE